MARQGSVLLLGDGGRAAAMAKKPAAAGAGPAANSFANPNQVGYLSEMDKGLISDSWKDRYAVLDGKQLWIYKGRNDAEPVGLIRLCDKTTVKRALAVSRGSAFTIQTPLKAYTFAAPRNAEMDTWITDIEMAIKGQRQKKTPNISRGF